MLPSSLRRLPTANRELPSILSAVLDRELLRKNPDDVRAGIARKGLDATAVDRFLALDAEFRAARVAAGDRQAAMNAAAKSIGGLMAKGLMEEAEAAKKEAAMLKAGVQEAEAEGRRAEEALRTLEFELPNLPHPSVPDGRTETENVEIRRVGELAPPTTPHWETAERLGLIDLTRAAKIAGSGFVVYTGVGARLQRALGSFFVDHQVARGYREVYPPVLVNAAALTGTGNLPKFADDLYKVEHDDLYLIPTAEVPLTNLHAGEILEAADLPVRYAGFSGCFRREAGAAGKDTRGLLRIHQFDKVELVKLVEPSASYDELETLIADAESVAAALGLTYRVLELCAGDLGAKGAKCYDLEVWAPGVERWLEVSSCTNFEAYQSRRANLRYRPAPGEKPEFLHVLNGSGLAVPRVMAALLETHLQADGTVVIPEPLRPYMGGSATIG